MPAFDVIAVLLVLAALFGYVNFRYIKLPTTIGLMLLGLIFSLLLIAAGKFSPAITETATAFVSGIEFDEALLGIMLSYLLFAGALHVNLGDLANQKIIIAILATVGVVFSTFVTGSACWLLLNLLGITPDYIYCLLFGALISPTDPVAVLGILKKAGAPKSLETKITGESLFNDGVGVVVFLSLLAVATDQMQPTLGNISLLFAQEILGGLLLGLVLGLIGFSMLKQIDNYQVEILITLALVTGGYSLANRLHISGPLAMVVAGLIIGNQARALAMSRKTEKHLDTFWELIDEILNAMLFLLIGLEVLTLEFQSDYLIFGLLAIPLILAVRLIAVALPVMLLKRSREFSPRVIRALTWGGLRGGISVALALSLPKGETRDLLLMATYMVVIFSIAIQGTTLRYFLPKPENSSRSKG
ncbi:MAG: sodium:proton antiporter [Verrucomicrobiaceae bacterium]|nr:sodium:proton antiporter [Verrucomicrobiaceae bacterium]